MFITTFTRKNRGFTQPTTLAGFTLVETLVAISILLLAIIGPMTIAQKGIQNSLYASDQTTAVFLAQEAIEAVRQLRDEKGLLVYQTPTLYANTWIAPMVTECALGCAYDGAINPVNPQDAFGSCNINNDCILNIRTLDQTYTHQTSGANPTMFTRKVYITSGDNVNATVSVEVTWNSPLFGNTLRTVRLQTWLMNQYSRFESIP